MKHSMRGRGRLASAGMALLAATLVAGLWAPSPAGAFGSDLLYSTDGGATWSPDVTVGPGGTVLARAWYDNDDTSAYDDTYVGTSLPAGFSLVPGTTQVCKSPLTTNPTSPNDGEDVCAASDEGAVWSGQDLQVSPTAGLFGQSNADTTGILEMGKVRYVNLHECAYASAANNDWLTWSAVARPSGVYQNGSNVSNSPDSAATCGPGSAQHVLSGSGTAAAYDLLDNRYLNLHECAYVSAANSDWLTWSGVARPSGVYANGSNASNAPDGAAVCGPGSAQHVLSGGTAAAYDLLDQDRGRGFVEFVIEAPSPATTTTYDTDAELFAYGEPHLSSGSITVDTGFVVSAIAVWPVAAGTAGLLALGGWFVLRRRGDQEVALPA